MYSKGGRIKYIKRRMMHKGASIVGLSALGTANSFMLIIIIFCSLLIMI